MRFGSVCSGIEAASVAWDCLGWQADWFAEIEPFPSAILAHHYPSIPNLGDMTTLPNRILSSEAEAPDILCGGTPCQAFSVAGARQSLDDARGNLTLTFCEIANAIDKTRINNGQQPSIIIWENVPGVLNTKDNAFGCFLGKLAGEDMPLQPAGKRWTNAGVVSGPKRTIAWRVLDAKYFGLAQRRKRVFVVASAREGFNPATVLFEFNGMRRDTAPSREKGERITSSVKTGVGSGSNPELMAQSVIPLNTMTMLGRPSDDLKPRMGSGIGTVIDPCPTLTKAHSHAVCYSLQGFNKQRIGEYSADDIASTCAASDYKDATDLVTMSDVAGPLDASYYKGQGSRQGGEREFVAQATYGIAPCQTKTDVHGVAYSFDSLASNSMRSKNPISGCNQTELAKTIDTTVPCPSKNQGGVGIVQSLAVRRLTPTECERLQGFPDGYTAIPWRKKPAEECPDGPRYKALGNSWAVPVVGWIGQRIKNEILNQKTGSVE